jgi:hypothetical protein
MVADETERDWARTIWLIYTCRQAADRHYSDVFCSQSGLEGRDTAACEARSDLS